MKRNLKGQFSHYNYSYSLLPFFITFFLLLLIIAGNVMAFTERTVYTSNETIKTIMLVDESRPDILRKIAECESGDSHFDNEGNVIRGLVDSNDTGRYQINKKFWGSTAMKMGLNLEDEMDNYRFALYLLNNYGSVPWVHSSKCWYHK